MARDRFRVSDIAQQAVGAILLAGPFVVTEEVWRLAGNMDMLRTVLGTVVIALIGYGALYKADRGRDPDSGEEPDVYGVPFRFLSLMAVSYGAVAFLVVLFRAPATFDAGTVTLVKAVTVGTIFAVVGAATADSVF